MGKISRKHISLAHAFAIEDYGHEAEYVRFGNKVGKIIENTLGRRISLKTQEDLALMITLYMEDIISESGIWAGFILANEELLGRKLPFYDTSDYYLNEPNLADILFLLWYGLQDTKMVDSQIHPFDPTIKYVASEIYNLCLDQFDQLEINDALHNVFRECVFMDDFFELRKKLVFLMERCYLTSLSLEETLSMDYVQALLELYDDPSVIQYQLHTNLVFQLKCGPLALRAQDWLYYILKANGKEEEANSLRQIKVRPYATYLVEKCTDTDMWVRSLDNQVFSISYFNLNIFYEQAVELKHKNIMMCLTNYNGDWHLNGFMSQIHEEGYFEYDQQHYYTRTLPDEERKRERAQKTKALKPEFLYFRDKASYKKYLAQQGGVFEDLIQRLPPDDQWLKRNGPVAIFSRDLGLAYIGDEDNALMIKDEKNPYYDSDFAEVLGMSIFRSQMTEEALAYLIEHKMLPYLSFGSSSEWQMDLNWLVEENWRFIYRMHQRVSLYAPPTTLLF